MHENPNFLRDAKTPPDVKATDAALNDELKELNIRMPPNIKDTCLPALFELTPTEP